jgi:hypothetical protein
MSYGSEELTHFGGALLLHQFFRRLGLRSLLTKEIPADWRNTRYSVSDMILAVVYPIILGLGRVEGVSWMRHNGVFQYLTGLERYPDLVALRRFLSRLGQARGLRMFESLHDRLRVGFLGKPSSVTFDLDSTVLTVYGHQRGARVGFNPKKPGRPSYMAHLCVEGGTHDCWAACLRPGNAHVLQDVQPMLNHAMGKLPRGVREVRVRADGAFYDGKLLSYLEARQARYAIVARLWGPLVHRLRGLSYEIHKGRVETSELVYQAAGWSRARRIVVIRRPVPEEPSWQLTLFRLEGRVYQARVTNLELQPLNAWRFYNERAHVEQVIREWKHGGALGQMPRQDAAANAGRFHLVLFAFNLLNWFKRLCAVGEMAKATIPILRQRLLNVPAALARPQGKPLLKLPAGYPYAGEFEATLQRTRRFRVPPWGGNTVEPWFTHGLDAQ